MKHVASLRLSLLVSLGLIPVACGGTTLRGNSDEDSGGSGGSSSGASQGGKKPTSAGSSNKGGSSNVAGTTSGGVTSVGGATGTTGGSTLTGGAGPTHSCTMPALDPATGLVSCKEGFRHRPSAKRCEGVPDQEAIGGTSGEGGARGEGAAPLPRAPSDASISCTTSEDCSQYDFGFCAFAGQIRVCRSGCSTDAECGAGYVCSCGNAWSPTGGECVPSDCKTDADCGADSLCASYSGICGGGGFACLRASDQCVGNSVCSCTWSPDRGRFCNDAVCGRPFLVEAETRVAPIVSDARWSAFDAVKPRVDHLTFGERAVLTEHWTRMGQMEHASIAAFARFSLQLLALGAPPDLVEGCTAALADETAHTQLCFRIASVYAGRAVGPGPLDVSGNLLPTSLVDVVELVIAEGCFGETSAAIEALEAAETASDPVIAAAYQRIATDERRHAELAFRFVGWALEQAPREVAACVQRAIVVPPSSSVGASEVSVPCLRAMLEREGAAAGKSDFAARAG